MLLGQIFVRLEWAMLGLLLILAYPRNAQTAESPLPANHPAQFTQHETSPFGDLPPNDPAGTERRLRALNAERQKAMVSDVDKLLKLAHELDAEIAENKSDGLTSDEMHKLATIEKLARSVKQKMVLSWGGGPEFHMPSTPPQAQPGSPH